MASDGIRVVCKEQVAMYQRLIYNKNTTSENILFSDVVHRISADSFYYSKNSISINRLSPIRLQKAQYRLYKYTEQLLRNANSIPKTIFDSWISNIFQPLLGRQWNVSSKMPHASIIRQISSIWIRFSRDSTMPYRNTARRKKKKETRKKQLYRLSY